MNKPIGKAITARISPHVYEQLERLSEKKGIKKSAIITLAVEMYAKAEEKAEREAK